MNDHDQLYVPSRVIYQKKGQERAVLAVQNAVEQARAFYGKCPQLVIWVFAEKNSPDYARFKHESVALGIASQAIQATALSKRGNVQLAVNLGMKINAKLGGQCFRLDKDSTSGSTTSSRGWLSTVKPMIVGANLSHEPDRPSVAVLVASMDDDAIICTEESRIQSLAEPSPAAPPHTPAPKREIIVDAHEMLLALLKHRVFAEEKAQLPPTAILLILRDGISEGEYAALVREEIGAYRSAIQSFKTDEDMVKALGKGALDAYMPTLSVVACIKGHHVRFFPAQDNMVPGTVVDSGVTSPRSADFYLASHRAQLGPTRPTRYELLVDENNLSPDQVQSTVSALCYTYQRCNKAVSLPAPVYYAHLIAAKIRGWTISDLPSGDSSAHSGPDSSESRLADYDAAKQKLERTAKGRTAFRCARPPTMWWV